MLSRPRPSHEIAGLVGADLAPWQSQDDDLRRM
jgi:hypothetical protein